MAAPEDRYRALLLVSEAANAERALDAVLSAASAALNQILRVDSVGVFELRGETLTVRAVHVHGIEARPGESIVEAIRRAAGLPHDLELPLTRSLPLAGTGTEHVMRTRRAHLCTRLGEGEKMVVNIPGREGDVRRKGYHLRQACLSWQVPCLTSMDTFRWVIRTQEADRGRPSPPRPLQAINRKERMMR